MIFGEGKVLQVLDAPTGSNADECKLLQLEKPLGYVADYPHLSNGHLLLDFQPVSEVDDFVEVKGKEEISNHINPYQRTLVRMFFPHCCLLLYLFLSILRTSQPSSLPNDLILSRTISPITITITTTTTEPLKRVYPPAM